MPRLVHARDLDATTTDNDDGRTGSQAAVRLLGCAIAMLVVSFLVVTRSSSALVDSATATSTHFRSGVVALSDDDEGRTLFQLPAFVPGRSETRCIDVSYTGDVDGVRVAMRGDGGGELARALDMSVEVGSGGSFDDCSSFRPEATLFAETLEQFLARHGRTSAGLDAFFASAGSRRTFRFTFTLDGDRAAQGASAGVDFLWTASPP